MYLLDLIHEMSDWNSDRIRWNMNNWVGNLNLVWDNIPLCVDYKFIWISILQCELKILVDFKINIQEFLAVEILQESWEAHKTLHFNCIIKQKTIFKVKQSKHFVSVLLHALHKKWKIIVIEIIDHRSLDNSILDSF